MMQQENVTIREGVTWIVDEQGSKLIQVELTPNMLIILDTNETVYARIFRAALKYIDDMRGEK